MTCWGKLDDVTSRYLPTFYETDADWELIVVDNASPDNTGEWLSREAQGKEFLKPILLDTNLGYAGGLNAGLEVAQGDYIVCMNNDIACSTPRWLENVFQPIRDNPKRLLGPRLISDNWMTDIGDGPIPYLEGWLIAADRDFWEKSRGWDTRYEVAWFEDVDLSWRAVQLGYELYEHPGAPVLHMFGRTAYRSGLDFHSITQRNKAQFSNVYFGLDVPWHELDKTMLISGLMRTYNEAENLKISLPNWLQFCDEIVISDGGSTDNSKEVAQALCGDKLVWLDFPGGSIHDTHWQNHAGQQLNYGLDHCQGEWVVTMDADAIYCERFCKDIRHILADAKYPAYVMFGAHIVNDWEEYADHMMDGPGVVQIFRNQEGIRFPDRPEEAHQIFAFEDEQVGILNLGIFHWGYMNRDKYIDKLQRRVEVFKEDNDQGGLADSFSQALAHFSTSGWGETQSIPWDDCHAACNGCWMRKRALERRSDLDWTKK